MTDCAKNAVRQLDGIIIAIQLTGLLTFTDDVRQKIKIAAALLPIDRTRRNLLARGKDGRQNQAHQVLVLLCETKEGDSNGAQPGLTIALLANRVAHKSEGFIESEVHDGAKKSRLALEIIVKRWSGEAGGFEDVLYGSARIPFAREDGNR